MTRTPPTLDLRETHAPGLIGYLGRMHIYFAEVLPLPRHLLVAVLTYLALASFSRVVHGESTSLLSRFSLSGVWSVLNVFVLLRVMDSLKDRESDLADFPERPLPSGRVTERDVRITLWLACVALPLVNLLTGLGALTALGVLLYLLLMYRWFFLPELISNDRLLAILTHHPIYPLLFLHLVTLFALEHDLGPSEVRWAVVLPFVILIWLPFLAWELSRKIRAPEEETRYETYSSRLGPRGAVVLSLSAEVTAMGLATYLAWVLTLPVWYLALIGLGLAISAAAHLRYAIHPSPNTARLEPYGALFGATVVFAQLAAFVPLAL